MLLTVSTTHRPATELGYLLHKHPDRVQAYPQSFGTATVLYPESSEERCTAAVVLEVDPVRLARGRGKDSPDFSLAQYVNDRSYAASSLLAVAMADVLRTARSGRCQARQELADSAIPLEITIPVLPCRGGAQIAHRVFEPLGWTVYTDSLDVLRNRHLGKKRQLASREHGLGLDALSAFVDQQPLWKVHQSVFAVLALESEPVDPRL